MLSIKPVNQSLMNCLFISYIDFRAGSFSGNIAINVWSFQQGELHMLLGILFQVDCNGANETRDMRIHTQRFIQ